MPKNGAMKTLQARLHAIEQLATGIQRFEFRPTDEAAWPAVSAGAHVELHLAPRLSRSYSLVNAPGESHRYVVAVQRNATGQGGSRYLHDTLRVGDELQISAPRNAFPLEESAAQSILIAGGIGITPLWSMAQRLAQLGRPWTLHYATRTPASAAYAEQFVALAANSLGKVKLYFDGGVSDQGLDLQAIAQDSPADAHLYCCGPAGMLKAFEAATAQLPPARVHREYFAAPPAPAQDAKSTDQAFRVRLSKSGQLVPVDSGTTILDALLNAGVDVPYSCMSGICGMCTTGVLGGVPDHRDHVLSEAEKACGQQIILCCSRAKSPELVLDL